MRWPCFLTAPEKVNCWAGRQRWNQSHKFMRPHISVFLLEHEPRLVYFVHWSRCNQASDIIYIYALFEPRGAGLTVHSKSQELQRRNIQLTRMIHNMSRAHSCCSQGASLWNIHVSQQSNNMFMIHCSVSPAQWKFQPWCILTLPI